MKYILHYDINKDEGRNYALSAVNKVNYIIKTLNTSGHDIDIISSSLVSDIGYIKGSKTDINANTKLIKLPAFKWGNKLQKLAAYIWGNVALLCYLLFKIKKDETVFVYHSLSTMKVINLVKKLKRFDLILEVEEIYSDVTGASLKKRQRELKCIQCADKYIFPTEMLNSTVNDTNKPFVIIHGTYEVEMDRYVSFNDDKTHVVYAGTFDPRKGGAAAAAAALYLPENYHIHILGFGTDSDTDNIKDVIKKTNEKSRATVTYDGLLSGDAYIEFLQKCHIGLSTQNPDAEFNATSFPSKILSYMANGLRVVTVRIPAIENSAIGQDVYYYDNQTPEGIAKAIMSVDFNDGYKGREKISELDSKFRVNLKTLLGEQ